MIGITTLHASSPDALIFISGLNYDTDFTFFDTNNGTDSWKYVLDSYREHLVFEAHIYR